MPEEVQGLLTVDNTKEIELLTSILVELQRDNEPEVVDPEFIDPMQFTLDEILLLLQGEQLVELEEEWKEAEKENILAEIEAKELEEQKLLEEQTLLESVFEPINPDLVTTVTSNVILLTAIILVSYAVMEILRGLLNISTWLFELPMPAVFKAGLKTKSITPSRRDDD